MARRWKEPSFAQWMLLFAVAFLGGALLGALILGVGGYLTYKPDPNCVGLFCPTSPTYAAEWDAFGGAWLGALIGIGLWVLVKVAVWARFRAP